jgi:RNA polymerase sigma-70 factor (ECF subfamily)
MDAEADVALVRKARNGDAAAFGLLVERYQRPVFNLALQMVRVREDAQDVAQSAFVRAYRQLARFDERYRFFSWIYRITVNEALRLRSGRRHHESISDDLASGGRSPEDQLSSDETTGLVQQALRQLAPGDRELIVLRHLLQRSYAEMGEALGLAENTVKSRLFTARRRLCEVLRRSGVTQP